MNLNKKCFNLIQFKTLVFAFFPEYYFFFRLMLEDVRHLSLVNALMKKIWEGLFWISEWLFKNDKGKGKLFIKEVSKKCFELAFL